MEKINLHPTNPDDNVNSINNCEKYKPQLYPLHLHNQINGNILKIHHTIEENDKIVRIVLKVACFNLRGHLMLAIDKRGNIFILDFIKKCYWRHPKIVRKPTIVVSSLRDSKEFLIGTKMGSLFTLHIDNSKLICLRICDSPIKMISFPHRSLEPKSLCLIQANNKAFLIDLCTVTCLHRLHFDDDIMILKFAFYVPHTEQILTCFSNDSLYLWSGIKLEVLRVIYPLKLRDRKLQLQQTGATSPIENIQKVPKLYLSNCEENCPITSIVNPHEGSILSYCCQNDGSLLCLTTADNYLLMLSIPTFELTYLIKLHNFLFKCCAILPKYYNGLLLGLTNYQTVVLCDYINVEIKLILDVNMCCNIHLSKDGHMLAIINGFGEIFIWMVQNLVQTLRKQKHFMELLKKECKQDQTMVTPTASNTVITTTEIVAQNSLHQELKKLLTRPRLEYILKEYHCYPAKYRLLIWTTLLELPQNKCQFEELLHMKVPDIIKQKAECWPIKNVHLRRNFTKCWSHLARWCKIFAYNDFIPHLIFPFVKIFQTSELLMFEVCVTLIFNHFQLYFEYHPMEPRNYLGICSNLLKYYDAPLYDFYNNQQITANIYAWLILRSAFAEICDQQQWLCLWDNIITAPPYYPIFCIIAYNIMQRNVIRRLPNSHLIKQFFTEQNPLDIKKLILKANKLMTECPDTLHPRRYITSFVPLPNGVYPKFLKYPLKCLEKFEQKIFNLQEFNSELNQRMHYLENEELEILHQLENGLRNEEQMKRLKEIESYYHNIIKKEEERIQCQRKLLLVYQKEIRNRKSQTLNILQQSHKRQNVIEKERELDKLQYNVEIERLRDDINLMWAEEELRNQEMEILAQECLSERTQQKQHRGQTLYDKFHNNIKHLCEEHQKLETDLKKLHDLNPGYNNKKLSRNTSDYINLIECKLKNYQEEFNILKGKMHVET